MTVTKHGITGSRPPSGQQGKEARARFERLLEYGYAWIDSLPVDGSIVLWHGAAPGVDQELAARAHRRGIWVVSIPAPWISFQKLGLNKYMAGPVRNEVLVEISDHITAFWDGASKGTHGCIRVAQKAGKLRGIWTPEGEIEWEP